MTVKTADGRCYEGILEGYVSQSELCLTFAVELGATPTGLARPVNQTATKAICIPMADVVCLSAMRVPEDEVVDTPNNPTTPGTSSTDGFTDECVRKRAGHHSSTTVCQLQEFELEPIEGCGTTTELLEDLTLESGGPGESSWSAEAMFAAAPNCRPNISGKPAPDDFEASFETKYSSVPINITEDYQERLRRAEQLTREITDSNPSASHLELENQESEEARFSAVERVVQSGDRIEERPAGSTTNPRAGTVPLIRGPPPLVNGMDTPTTTLPENRSSSTKSELNSLKKFAENFKLASANSKEQTAAPPKEQRPARSRPSVQASQQAVVKVAAGSASTGQSVAEESTSDTTVTATDDVPAAEPASNLPSGSMSESTTSTEEGTPRSNLNPDAFEFKPRWQQQPVATEMVQHAPPPPPPPPPPPTAAVPPPNAHMVQQQVHSTQPVMMIPQQYSAAGQPQQPNGGSQVQAPPHSGLTTPSPGPMAVYPQVRAWDMRVVCLRLAVFGCFVGLSVIPLP